MPEVTADELLAAIPYVQRIGIVLDSADPDRVVGHLDWDESLCTLGGILHGAR